MICSSLSTTKRLLFLSEYFNAPFLQPHIWKCNAVFSSGVDGLLSNRAKEMGLQRDQTELRHFPSSWRGDFCTFSFKCTVQNFAILSWTHLLEASRLPCEELGDLAELELTGVPSSTVGTLTSLGLPDPWQSPRNAVPNPRDLELCLSDNLHYKTTLGHFRLQFPGYFLKDSAYLQGAWEAKLNGDTQSQPPLHPVLQKSLCHPRLHQGTVMVSLSQLGLVLFLLLPSLMKLPTWYLYLLNNTYHHTTASFSTASPSPSYVPRAKHNQEGGKKWKEITISDPVLLRFQNCEGEKIYCSFPWKDGSYQKTLTTATALFMNKTLILLVLFIYAAETARCQTRRKIPDAEHMSKQS